MRYLTAWIALAALLADAGAMESKDLRNKKQRLYDIQLREAQLDVDIAKLEMDTNLSSYEENRELFEANMQTLDQLNQYQRLYNDAKLAYDQAVIALESTRLSFLNQATHATIAEAKKYRTAKGTYKISLTLENTSNIRQAAFLNPGKSEAEVGDLLRLRNVKISIEGEDGLAVCSPYEVSVLDLGVGERETLELRLLQERDDVVVKLTTAAGYERAFAIVLGKESLQDFPQVNSMQFSQEGDLNNQVRYDLLLERLGEDEQTFHLTAAGLPEEIKYTFRDRENRASLTQVKFSEEVTDHQLELELQIPEKLSREYVDETIRFCVFVTDQEGLGQVDALRGVGRPDLDVERVNGNRVLLELVPRGRGALELLVVNRYQEAEVGVGVINARIELLNTGTLDIGAARVALFPPAGWSYASDPETVEDIAPGEKKAVDIALTPVANSGPSEYDIRIEAVGRAAAKKVEAHEKVITVRLEKNAGIMRNLAVIGAVIAVVVGVAVFSVKNTKR